MEPTIEQIFEVHRRGRTSEARGLYERLLKREPGNLQAAQLLGALLLQEGKNKEAALRLEGVVHAAPDLPLVWVNLGTAYSRMQRLAEAENCYKRALNLDSSSLDASQNLGSVLVKQEKYGPAVRVLEKVISQPNASAMSRANYGLALLGDGNIAEGAVCLEGVLGEPDLSPSIILHLGRSLLANESLAKERGLAELAVKVWQVLEETHPDDPAFANNLATVLKHAERYVEAVELCDRIISRWPNFFPAMGNLGIVLAAQTDFVQAAKVLEKCLDRAKGDVATGSRSFDSESAARDLWREKHEPILFSQLAAAYNMSGQADLAKKTVESGLAVYGEDHELRLHRGFLRLQAGDYLNGWPDYETRRQIPDRAPRTMPKEEWVGQALAGKTILIHCEQGLGDTIQFCRYAELFKRQDARVLLLGHRPVCRLLSTCDWIDEVIEDGDPLLPYDYHIPLMSLPARFETSFESVPAKVPYIRCDQNKYEYWKNWIQSRGGKLTVGIAWQGNPEFSNDHLRSVPLRHFAPLAAVAGTKLISLQKGYGTEQIQEIDFEVIQPEKLDEQPFEDTAAIMSSVDLVISSDTATVHLAGALGANTWLAKSFAPEWRWLADDRPNNPWYPTLTMFKQPKMNDWSSVFQKMQQALESLSRSKTLSEN